MTPPFVVLSAAGFEHRGLRSVPHPLPHFGASSSVGSRPNAGRNPPAEGILPTFAVKAIAVVAATLAMVIFALFSTVFGVVAVVTLGLEASPTERRLSAPTGSVETFEASRPGDAVELQDAEKVEQSTRSTRAVDPSRQPASPTSPRRARRPSR